MDKAKFFIMTPGSVAPGKGRNQGNLKELHIRFEAVKCTGNHVHHFQGISPAEDATSKQLKWAI